uniref:Uncharacterized protein n=1 Tax=Panagrolaimus sp. ES5 TaxID=591445 RepID=A0AC34GG82_9BILA
MTFRHFMKKNVRSASEASTVISTNLKVVKLAILGSTGVGKTSIVKYYVNNKFDDEEEYGMVEVYQKQKVINGESYILEIVDTGHELSESDTTVKQHVIGADGYMLIFSILNIDSLNALSDFRTQIRQARRQSTNFYDDVNLQIPMIIVANKVDLNESEKLLKEMREKIQCFYLPFVQTSAKTGYGIQDAFDVLVEEVERTKNPAVNHLQTTLKQRKLSYVQNFIKNRCIIL